MRKKILSRTTGSVFLLLLGLLLARETASGKDIKPPADPAASKLLADARAARAQWENFPGFQADLEVNLEGKITRGHVTVSPRGKLKLDLDDPAAQEWARETLGSVVFHRLDNSAAMQTPCAFMDQDATNPLGRAIRVLNDEFHSSYRIRDRQIIVVNRHMKDARFSITVLKNVANAEKKFLPACYVVNTWDLKTGALRSSDAFHQTWERVGSFDLPRSVLIVTATAGKQEARSLTLAHFQLSGS